jgi:hypothetical protein
MPPDLRDCVPEGHLVHFIMDAVRLLDVGQARVNERGTGSPQYPPTRMLGLLIDPENRSSSGMPAHADAQTLGVP